MCHPDGKLNHNPLAKLTDTCWYKKSPVCYTTLRKALDLLATLLIIPFVPQP